MERYAWPNEFKKSPDRLDARAEHQARAAGQATPPALLGELDALDDVIQANFDEDRLWLPLGPSILINGQASGNPIVSGRVRAIHVSDDGQRIYVGAANGGVWYSNDAAASWHPLGSWGLAPTASRSDLSLTIGAMLVKFGASSADDIVYVATGEARPWVSGTPGARHAGIGVLKLEGSVDAALANAGGNPWRREGINLTGTGIFRLARNPGAAFTAAGEGELVAATSNGLWARAGAFQEDADWTRVNFTPSGFDANDGPYCSDVVWNDKGLWVTLVRGGSEDGLYRATGGTGGGFDRITLPNHQIGTRLSLAPAPHDDNKMYVLGLRPPPVDPANNRGLAHLWLVDLGHASTAAVEVDRFPVGLFTSTVEGTDPNFEIKSDQADYDQAIAVTQDGSDDVVFVGGSTKSKGGSWNASLFELKITGSAAANDLATNFTQARQKNSANDPTFRGSGIHPDVHVLTPQSSDLWVGSDGGVFLLSGGNARSMNAGLATAEAGYIASHPTLDGPMLAGTQDNGAIQRIGNTVWRLLRKGDGGGCAYHPTQPHETLNQYIKATWQFDPYRAARKGPVQRSASHADPSTTGEATEEERASFYSMPAVAKTGDDHLARLFVGTDRIWYSANWNDRANPMSWVTIPSGVDAWNAARTVNNTEQDRLTPTATSQQAEKVLVIDILQEGDTAQNFDGMAILVLTRSHLRIFRYTHASTSWTPVANSVISGRPSEGSCCNAVPAPDPFLNWLPRPSRGVWTDIAVHTTDTPGAETFYVATTGSVTVSDDGSLNGDPNVDTLWWYNGAGRWYPTGLRNTPLDTTAGTGGCPLSAHAVTVDPIASDIVYVGTRIGVWEGRIDRSRAHPSWTWKPAMEGLPQALVEDLHVMTNDEGAYLRAALVARGIWERDISVLPISVGRTFIRSVSFDSGRTSLPEVPKNPEDNSALTYHESPDIILLPEGAGSWGTGTPNEAELLAVTKPAVFDRQRYDLYAMVHHRHTTPVNGADVNVDLFMLRGAPAGSISDVAMAPIRQFILDQVRNGTNFADSSLSYLGRFHPGQAVDARNSRAIRTTVDLSFGLEGGGPHDHVALIAVVTSPDNPLANSDLARADLEEVVRRTGRVAVRKICRQ